MTASSEFMAGVTDDGLVQLLDLLKGASYDFVTPTPATHALVRRRRPAREGSLLRDIFGWTRPFHAAQVDASLLRLMQAGDLLVETDGFLVSRLRVSTLGGRYYLHSAPTTDAAAVFLGPDSYRFASLLARSLKDGKPFRRALDIGTGAGVGAITLQDLCPGAEVFASDINPAALRLAGLNARHAGLPLRLVEASGLPAAPATFDLIVANPPYIAGDTGKTYRDGGDDIGTALGMDWARSSLDRLSPQGRFLLYTGAPVIEGRDIVRDALTALCAERDFSLSYEEIEGDVFGGTLRQAAYQDVDRIAAVGAIVQAP